MSTTPHLLDLDAALDEQEQNDEPLVVKLFGEEWDLPGSIPAAVTIRVAEWYEDGLVDENGKPVEGSELTGAQCLLLLRDMVPPDVLNEWHARGLGTDQYARYAELLMLTYRKKAGEAAGEAPAPKGANNRATRRASSKSSNAGRSLKRTSTASTRSRTSSKS